MIMQAARTVKVTFTLGGSAFGAIETYVLKAPWRAAARRRLGIGEESRRRRAAALQDASRIFIDYGEPQVHVSLR